VGNTYAYLDPELRGETYKRAREVLWAFDAAWGKSPRHLVVLNFLRPFGGPLQMMMRRYRYVEDGLVIGKPETKEVVEKARENIKLCKCLPTYLPTYLPYLPPEFLLRLVNHKNQNSGYRVEAGAAYQDQATRFTRVLENKKKLLFPGLAELLVEDVKRCDQCVYRLTYGVYEMGGFGRVKLCEGCRDEWRKYAETLPQRAAAAFAGYA